MSFNEWLWLATACLAGAISPGPSLALVLLHASRSRRDGLICSWSHALGVGIYAGLAVSGLALVLAQQIWLARLLYLIAALWLLRLCYLTWQQRHAQLPQLRQARAASRDGLSMALVNPKVALFFVALFTAALPADVSAPAAMLAVLTAILMDGGWYSLISLLLQQPRLRAGLQGQLPRLAVCSALILALMSGLLLLRVMV